MYGRCFEAMSLSTLACSLYLIAAGLFRRLWRSGVHTYHRGCVGRLRLLSWRLQTWILRQRMVEATSLPSGVRLVAGVDLSCIKGSETDACAALVVLELPSLAVVYEDMERVTLNVPYMPGFLAFREVRHCTSVRSAPLCGTDRGRCEAQGAP